MTEKEFITSTNDYDYGAADYKTVVRLAIRGALHNFNRQIPADVLDRLDPDGRSVFQIVLFDHDRSGRPDIGENDPMHHRCMALLKLQGTDEPHRLFVDISDEDFRALDHMKSRKEQASDYPEGSLENKLLGTPGGKSDNSNN